MPSISCLEKDIETSHVPLSDLSQCGHFTIEKELTPASQNVSKASAPSHRGDAFQLVESLHKSHKTDEDAINKSDRSKTYVDSDSVVSSDVHTVDDNQNKIGPFLEDSSDTIDNANPSPNCKSGKNTLNDEAVSCCQCDCHVCDKATKLSRRTRTLIASRSLSTDEEFSTVELKPCSSKSCFTNCTMRTNPNKLQKINSCPAGVHQNNITESTLRQMIPFVYDKEAQHICQLRVGVCDNKLNGRGRVGNRTDEVLKKSKTCCDRKKRVATSVALLSVVTLSIFSILAYYVVTGSKNNAKNSAEVTNRSSGIYNFSSWLNGKYDYFNGDVLANRTINVTAKRYQLVHPSSKKDRLLYQTEHCGRYPVNTKARPQTQEQNIIDPRNRTQGNSRVKRIIGGKAAHIRAVPWQVLLRQTWLMDKPTKSPKRACGGAIITDTWILTVAHCIKTKDPAPSWVVYFGATATSIKSNRFKSNTIPVTQVIVHEDYFSDFIHDFDIGLVKLKTAIEFTASVKPICLPFQSHEFAAGTACSVSGWGIDEDNAHPTDLPRDILRRADVDILSDATCSSDDWLGELLQFDDRVLCAGKEKGGVDACTGDSGGALACYSPELGAYVLAGLVSWGVGCGLPRQPGVYTEVSYYTDWIWKKIQDN